MQNHSVLKGEEILFTIADRITALGTFNMKGTCQCAIVICKEHYKNLAAQGWDKKVYANSYTKTPGEQPAIYKNAA